MSRNNVTVALLLKPCVIRSTFRNSACVVECPLFNTILVFIIGVCILLRNFCGKEGIIIYSLTILVVTDNFQFPKLQVQSFEIIFSKSFPREFNRLIGL
jgi:hypothetical protein